MCRPKGGRTYREGQETTVCVYPLFHLGGIILYYLGLMSGATMVLYPKFDFETFLAANAKYKVFSLLSNSTFCKYLARISVIANDFRQHTWAFSHQC